MLRNGQTLIAVFVLLSFVASFANSEDLGVTTGQAAAQAAPSKDRKDNLNGASAAALAAGAMAQLSCMQMMKEARETGDKKLLFMAMQMCAQAAALMANAAQNQNNASKITSSAGNIPQWQAKEAKIDTAPKSDDFSLDLPSDNGDSEETPNDQSTYSGLFNKDPAGANESLPIGTTANSRAAAESTPLSPGVTLLNATNSALPNGAPGMSANGVSAPLRTGAGAFSALNNNPLGSKNPSASELDEEHNRKSRFGHPVLAALQNGSGASNNSEGSAFDNFMARMGAGGSPMAFAAAGGNFDLAYGLQGNASQKPLTIFEFASSQYKKAKTERKAFQKSRFTPKALHVQLSAE